MVLDVNGCSLLLLFLLLKYGLSVMYSMTYHAPATIKNIYLWNVCVDSFKRGSK